MRRRMRRRMIVGGMVILGVGYSAYKLTQPQTQQIEQHTGKKAEDLTEEELEGAMEELNIQAQEPTDEEMAQLEAGNDSPQTPSTQSTSQKTTDNSYLQEIEKIADLRDKGIITDEEFNAKKKDLLGI